MTLLGETGSHMLILYSIEPGFLKESSVSVFPYLSSLLLHVDYTSAYLIEELPPSQIKVHHPTSPGAATAGQSFTNHHLHCTWAAGLRSPKAGGRSE